MADKKKMESIIDKLLKFKRDRMLRLDKELKTLGLDSMDSIKVAEIIIREVSLHVKYSNGCNEDIKKALIDERKRCS